jgi:hypothetical protein
MAEGSLSIWGDGSWKKIDLTKSSAIFRELAWLTQRFKIPGVLRFVKQNKTKNKQKQPNYTTSMSPLFPDPPISF